MGKRGPKAGAENAGRPEINIDWNEFEKLCILQCTLVEIADWFGCSEDTIENKVKEEYGETFSETFNKKRSKGKISLRRIQWKLAEKNPAMAIFLGKNYLKQTDSQLIEIENADEHCKRIADILEQSYTKAD